MEETNLEMDLPRVLITSGTSEKAKEIASSMYKMVSYKKFISNIYLFCTNIHINLF